MSADPSRSIAGTEARGCKGTCEGNDDDLRQDVCGFVNCSGVLLVLF